MSTTTSDPIEDLMTKIQAFGLACYVREPGADQIAMQNEIRAALTAHLAPADWRLVPVEPTTGMLLALKHAGQGGRERWAALLSAAPTHQIAQPAPPAERIRVEGPVNPGEKHLRHRLRKPGETLEHYRIAMGWDKQEGQPCTSAGTTGKSSASATPLALCTASDPSPRL